MENTNVEYNQDCGLCNTLVYDNFKLAVPFEAKFDLDSYSITEANSNHLHIHLHRSNRSSIFNCLDPWINKCVIETMLRQPSWVDRQLCGSSAGGMVDFGLADYFWMYT
jgi:hypothetical protein